jgi:hypothetical protein
VIKEAEIAEASADAPQAIGVKWKGTWTIPRPAHDVQLVAIATGPGIDGVYWHTAKPYQPMSPDWQASTIGCSGAIWLDIDNDGRRTSAREYAQRLVSAAGQNWRELVAKLSMFDETVAAHAAHLVSQAGTSLESGPLADALKDGSPAARAGFQAYREANRQNEIARAAR